MISFFEDSIYDKIRRFIEEANSILLLSHLDADGLSSAGIMGRLLMGFDKTFAIRIIKQLEDDSDIRESSADLIIITDMGSGQLNLIKKHADKKRFIIIDHHQIQGELEHDNLIHFNPNINDDSYSGSSLSFLVASKLNKSMEDRLFLAIVGAAGDMQYLNGFRGLNKEIIEKGVELGMLKRIKGLDIFGRASRPIHEALAYSFEVMIPGVSGNESGAIEFLSELNIGLKHEDGRWKTLSSLSDAEMKKLVTNIIMRRLNRNLDSNVLKDILVISGRKGKLSDIKEWSVMLNACGRQGAYGVGVLLTMGYESYALPLLEAILKDYKKLIVNGINLIKSKKVDVKIEEGIMLVDGKDSIKDTIIGTIGGILIKEHNAHTFVGLAQRDNGSIKVSCRTKKKMNIGELLKEVCEEVGCKGGGHKEAGGALVDKEAKDRFVSLLMKKIKEKHL